MTTAFYRIRVIKNGLTYDLQIHLDDEMSINVYVHEMLENGYGLDIEAVPVPPALSAHASLIWVRFFKDRMFSEIILDAYCHGHINAHELTALRRGWAALARDVIV